MGAFLVSITASVAARVMTSLGIGIFSYAALSTLASSVVSSVMSNYAGLSATTLAIVNLAGGGQALAIMTAGLVTRASLMAVKSMRPI